MENIHEVDKYLEKFLSEDSDLDKLVELIKNDLQKNGIILEFINKQNIHIHYLELTNWLKQLTSLEPIPEEVIAINFGLFESFESITMYISGSTEWDPEDSDWATNNDYFPEGRYFNSNIFSKISELLTDEDTAYVGIYLTLAVAISFIKQLKTESSITSFKNILHFSTGFDDGDLYNIF
jgi:hypothetical protein